MGFRPVSINVVRCTCYTDNSSKLLDKSNKEETMSKTVTLQLNEDEFNVLTATVWAKLAGGSDARRTLERKLAATFKSTFGVADPNVINKSPDSGVYVSSDAVQRDLDDWRKRKTAEVEGAQTFIYHGVERVVKDVAIDSKRRLLSGFELYRDGVPSNQFKHFKLNEIG
jgi:hypothetical protein